MDTKWNSTDKPVVIEGTPLKEGRPRGGRAKALIGFLAFVLGVSLTVSSLGNMGNRIVWERDVTPRWTADWQETDNFRMEVASILKNFLTIGAGGELDLYDYAYWTEHGEVMETVIVQAQEGGWPSTATSIAVDQGRSVDSSESAPAVPDSQKKESDANYKNDKNVLYHIEAADGKTYTNGDFTGNGLDLFQQTALEGYNFYLTFRNGKVTILKDGVELNVYGSGVYDSDSQWFVPGYDNFPATDQLDGVTVRMAVREIPVRYHYVDYKNGSTYNSSSMYYIAQRVRETQVFYRIQAILLGAGLAYLVLWLLLRKSTVLANRKIASWTLHIWTEARFLLVLFCGLWAFLPGLTSTDFYWALRYGYAWDYGYSFSDLGSHLARLLLANVPALLALVWLVWLIHNDHKYNSKEDRRSLLRPFLRALRARDLKRPVEKRISRTAVLLSLAVLILGGEVLFFLILLTDMGYVLPVWSLWTLFLFPVLLAGLATSALTSRQYHLAKDIACLTDQVEAVRAGDLNKPLDLPKDADLRQTAESLNDIQAGMKAALEEQTRSERMKVELVSNVSHDLKTPLTSILSYAELLRQEDLPPAAADYARIIDEKAQRLKGMVEDVFEISKAAASQLPVHLERLDLAKLLRQTLADMDGPIQKSALTFKVELPEEPVMITADGRRLYRVFQNLIDNALRYALEGSRVYLSLKTVEGTAGAARLAQASVRNTSRSELPEGVDFTARFVRGDTSRTDGGSGLGLSIASSFTEACGGTFRVETVADLFTAIVTFQTV